MLNSKFRTIFVTIHSEICLIVFYVQAYDNAKPLKNFFSYMLTGFRAITIWSFGH